MAITDWPDFFLPPKPSMVNGGYGLGSDNLNETADKVGWVIQCPKSGTLDKFEFRMGNVGNNPDNGIKLSFQTVGAATGNPDGVVDQFRNITGALSANAWTVPGLMTSDGTDGGVKRTVTRGEYLACVIEFVSFVASDSFNVSHLTGHISAASNNMYMVGDLFGSGYSKSTNTTPIFALKYDDGTYAVFPIPFWPAIDWELTSYNSGSTPDERALKYTSFAQNVRTTGVWAAVDSDNAVEIVLYNAADGVVDTITLDSDFRVQNDNAMLVAPWPNGPHTLTAGAVYRVAVKPTTGSSITLGIHRLPSNAYLAALPGGSTMLLSTRTDAGAWSDDDTRRPLIGLNIDGIEETVVPPAAAGSAYAFVG